MALVVLPYDHGVICINANYKDEVIKKVIKINKQTIKQSQDMNNFELKKKDNLTNQIL